METKFFEKHLLLFVFISVLSFMLGMFFGWMFTSEIDKSSIINLYNRVDSLELDLKEAQYDMYLDNNRIQYLEKKLQEITGEVQ